MKPSSFFRFRFFLRPFLFLVAMGIGLANLQAAEPELRVSSKRIRDEVHAVVETQLKALRAGDFSAAYELASSGIRQQFDVRLYAAMIRRGYPALLQASETEIGVVRDRDGVVAQVMVNLVDRRRRELVYSYWLVKEDAGWRVNGVVLEQRPARGDI